MGNQEFSQMESWTEGSQTCKTLLTCCECSPRWGAGVPGRQNLRTCASDAALVLLLVSVWLLQPAMPPGHSLACYTGLCNLLHPRGHIILLKTFTVAFSQNHLCFLPAAMHSNLYSTLPLGAADGQLWIHPHSTESKVWWSMAVPPALLKQRQEDQRLKDSLTK